MVTEITKSRATVGSELTQLLGPDWRTADLFCWGPDIFAVCGWLLETSGAYVRVLDQWPPNNETLDNWHQKVRKVASELRNNSAKFLYGRPCSKLERPEELWSIVCKNPDALLDELADDLELSGALIELVSIADEACIGFGLPVLDSDGENDLPEPDGLNFLEEVQLKLSDWDTLTPRFPTTKLCVLPKQHTPKSGITFRSLTHHLSLFTGGEVTASWSVQLEPRGSRLNLLVIPWPFTVNPSQFSAATCPNVTFAPGFKCFDYDASQDNLILGSLTFEDWLSQVFDTAKKTCGDVSGVILPEAALTPGEFEILEKVAIKYGSFVVAGVVAKADSESRPQPAKNEVWMTFGQDPTRIERKFTQAKHHRWRLDRTQIEMYGLGGSLDPNSAWWENIEVKSRAVNFIAVHGFLTLCCLICEDLARQDPVARLVRAVGPNLVIALLSDGPQIAARWPARYATVLADDPGSSVLTVTNLGMTQLAEPPPGKQKSRAIGLWKDPFGGLRELSLDPGSVAIVLNLWTQTGPEVAADGREDGGIAAFPALAGVHQIAV